MLFVIGSGPSGVACAAALLERGHAVTMLDAGVEYTGQVSTATSLQRNDPVKLVYGSDFPYAEVAQHISLRMDEHVHCMPSFAKGGLSNAWGGFVEQYTQENMQGWPITLQQLKPYYEKIYAFLQPQTHAPAGYQASQQAKFILRHWEAHTQQLMQAGFTYSTPQLAVKFFGSAKSCNYCGACLRGCPRELIYVASHTLTALLKNPNFHYIQNVIVTNIEETVAHVTIHAYERLTRKEFTLQASQVFTACGAIISTLLVLKATLKPQRAITFFDSTHFILPCLMKKRMQDVSKEEIHTLCQLFLKLRMQTMATKPIHLQIYTYMDLYAEQFKKIFKSFYRFIAPLLAPILERLIVIQGFLDSQESHQFTMELCDGLQAANLTSVRNHKVQAIIRKLCRYLKMHSKTLGFVPLTFMLKTSKIGKSFHYGCSLPMRSVPKEFETDIYGVPFGFKRLHIVDAAVLPSIAAGSITPTIMANAYRIASECHIELASHLKSVVC